MVEESPVGSSGSKGVGGQGQRRRWRSRGDAAGVGGEVGCARGGG